MLGSIAALTQQAEAQLLQSVQPKPQPIQSLQGNQQQSHVQSSAGGISDAQLQLAAQQAAMALQGLQSPAQSSQPPFSMMQSQPPPPGPPPQMMHNQMMQPGQMQGGQMQQQMQQQRHMPMMGQMQQGQMMPSPQAPQQMMGQPRPPRPPQTQKPEDGIDIAAAAALDPIRNLEKMWEFDKLRWKVATYFRTAAKDMSFLGPFDDLVNEFASKAFGNLQTAVGDRAWLHEADFAMILYAAVKETFPPEYLAQVQQSDFENGVLQAHDRAFEEARCLPMLWEKTIIRIEGKKDRKKVYEAIEAGRKSALQQMKGADPSTTQATPIVSRIEQFVNTWVTTCIEAVQKAVGWDPASLLAPKLCEELFQTFLQGGACIPKEMTRRLQAEGQSVPEPFPFLDQMVRNVYDVHKVEEPVKKSSQSHMKTWSEKFDPTYKTEMCWYFQNGQCTYGADCVSAHSEAELRPMPPAQQNQQQGGQSWGQPSWQGGGDSSFDGPGDGGQQGGWLFGDACGKGDSFGSDKGKGKGTYDGFDSGKGKGKDDGYGFDSGKGKGKDDGYGCAKGKGKDDGYGPYSSDSGKGKYDGFSSDKGKGKYDGFDSGKGKGKDGGDSFDGGKGKGKYDDFGNGKGKSYGKSDGYGCGDDNWSSGKGSFKGW